MEIPHAGKVTLVISDPTGREVVKKEIAGAKGRRLFPIDAVDWISGTYIARMEWGNQTAIIKLICVK